MRLARRAGRPAVLRLVQGDENILGGRFNGLTDAGLKPVEASTLKRANQIVARDPTSATSAGLTALRASPMNRARIQIRGVREAGAFVADPNFNLSIILSPANTDSAPCFPNNSVLNLAGSGTRHFYRRID